ncbi:MAG: murein biosynthesis integral membrane protein MurJ [Chloroflexi bacterium]|nr:murein biosynthesis integral membrane protein MurJ [Chloroflexota bacterium]
MLDDHGFDEAPLEEIEDAATATPSANRQIARAAGVVMAAFVLSNVVGLVRQILVSQAFGTGAAIDAFNAASRLPDLLFSLVAGGALGSAFIPTFTSFLARGERDRAWRLASSIANLVTLALMATSVVAWIFADPIVRHILAPGFSPEQQALTASLLRILLISPLIFGISGLVMGILNAHQRFLLAALAPTMYWLGMIFGVLVWAPKWGIYGLAWGAVLGAALHLGVQIPGLLRLPGRRYEFTLGLGDPAVREVGRLMAPRVLGVAIVQLNFWINVVLASSQPKGSLTAIQIAWAVMTMPQVVIAQAIAIAALPTFSAQVAQGRLDAMRRSLASTLRGVVLLALPAAVGLIVLRKPVVALLFQRGEFTERSTELVAWALLWYTLGLVSHSVVEIVSRAFYALHDTKTPVLVGSVAMSLNVGLSFAFVALFQRLGWMPHGGLALANTVATTLEMAGLLYLMRRRLAGLDGHYVLRGIAYAALGSAIMGVAVEATWRALAAYPLAVSVTLAIVVGAGVYVAVLWLLRTPELREVWQMARARWRRA